MADFAIISGSMVSNIIVAEDITVAQGAFPQARHIIDVSNRVPGVAIGFLYDEDANEFTRPETSETV